MEECLAELLMFIIGKWILHYLVIAIDKFIVQRRDSFVRLTRRLQSLLKLPSSLCIVSDTAPGITDESLRAGATAAIIFGMASAAALTAVAMTGTAITSVFGIVFGIILPISLFLLVWGYFIIARRRFDRGERDTYPEKGAEEGGNPGLQEAIRSVGSITI